MQHITYNFSGKNKSQTAESECNQSDHFMNCVKSVHLYLRLQSSGWSSNDFLPWKDLIVLIMFMLGIF